MAEHQLPCINPNLKHPYPVRLDWWEAAAAALSAGKGMHLCVGLWLMMAARQSPTVQLTRRTMARVNISRFATTGALCALEAAGLIRVWRLPGRSPMITATEPGTSTPLRLNARV